MVSCNFPNVIVCVIYLFNVIFLFNFFFVCFKFIVQRHGVYSQCCRVLFTLHFQKHSMIFSVLLVLIFWHFTHSFICAHKWACLQSSFICR